MTSLPRVSCRARYPEKCRYHIALTRADKASKRQDLPSFFKEQDRALRALRTSDDMEAFLLPGAQSKDLTEALQTNLREGLASLGFDETKETWDYYLQRAAEMSFELQHWYSDDQNSYMDPVARAAYVFTRDFDDYGNGFGPKFETVRELVAPELAARISELRK